MNTVLIILVNLFLLAIMILILLYFHLDHIGFRVEMRWRVVRTLLCTLAAETLECGDIPVDEREKIETFVKSKRQASQVARANQLKSLLVIPAADVSDLAERCTYYNEDVQQFNQMLEKPLWHFIATVFRVKPRLMVEQFDPRSTGLNPLGDRSDSGKNEK